MLLLSNADLEGLLDMPTAVALTEETLRQQADGKVIAHEPLVLRTSAQDVRINLGSLVVPQVAAVRAASRGGATLLFDTEANRLMAVMAYPGGNLRVGATVGLAVDRMARADAEQLTMIGTGTVARSCIEGIAACRQFRRVLVYSRDPQHRADFCAYARDFGVEAESVPDPEPAIRTADVVVLATWASAPVLHHAWLKPDAHVTTAGIRLEVDDDTYLKASLVAVTSKEHELRYRSNRTTDNVLLRLANSGALPWDSIHELAEIVAERTRVPPGITLFRESQGGYGDVPLIHYLYRRAFELGRGQEWDID